MILVVGATGLLGGAICSRLSERGESVRALARKTSDPARVQRLKSLGVEVVQGDLKDRASLEAACRGSTTVISTATTTLSRQPDDSIGGVDQDCPLHTAKRTVERHLRESGLTYTILRPSVFMEVWLSPALGFDFSKGTARLFGAGQRPISWISLGDVAVRCVGHPAARNAVLELGGPEALSPDDVVRTFEEVTGRHFETQHVPETELEEQWRGAADPLQKSFAALMLGFAQGDSIDMRQTLKVFPLREVTVREYATRVTAS